MDVQRNDASLFGRHSECAILTTMVTAARSGDSQVLVLRGGPGVGKSALLDYVADGAGTARIARANGVQSEMELVFAGLHELCLPFLDRLDRLPTPQRDALGTAFGLVEGPPPDRFLVGLAVLSLLDDAAEGESLVCLIDDVHWIDRASTQVLTFVARRLRAESIAMVFATRQTQGDVAMPGLPGLTVTGLDNIAALDLLSSVVTGPFDQRVGERIVAETRGNPLALLEYPRGQTTADLAFGFGINPSMPIANRVEQDFVRRLETLAADTRTLLLIGAAEPVGDPRLLWGAADRLGLDAAAATTAAAAGLVEVGRGLRFRHPLVRSAVYRSAPLEERQAVHRVLAEVTDPALDPDRHAWHRANGSPGFNEDIAAELERSAGRAGARGGLASSAAFRERAAQLTPDPARRAQRQLEAAQSRHWAGDIDVSLQLLASAQEGLLTDLDHARANLLHAQIVSVQSRGRDTSALLVEAARRLETLDPTLARETYLDAFSAAFSESGTNSEGGGIEHVAEAVRAARWGEAADESSRANDLLLKGLTLCATEGCASGAPTLKRALTSFREQRETDETPPRWLWLACRVARALADDASWHDLADQQVWWARQSGALSLLPIALNEQFEVHLANGQITAATASASELDAVVDATETTMHTSSSLWLTMWQGREAESLELIDATPQAELTRGEGLRPIKTDWAVAVLYIGLGRYDEALKYAERALEQPEQLGLANWVTPDVIEAAVRSGNPSRAEAPMMRLNEICRASGTDWALGLEARSRALLSAGSTAESLYREAIDRLAGTRVDVALARARLLYGEWLRRENRRVDAREQLRAAYQQFTDMGAEGFADRASRELHATGETVRKRNTGARVELTSQETHIARLASDGATNVEIGASMFISPRTVEWHMRKIFVKLDITSRRQLRDAHLDGEQPIVATR